MRTLITVAILVAALVIFSSPVFAGTTKPVEVTTPTETTTWTTQSTSSSSNSSSSTNTGSSQVVESGSYKEGDKDQRHDSFNSYLSENYGIDTHDTGMGKNWNYEITATPSTTTTTTTTTLTTTTINWRQDKTYYQVSFGGTQIAKKLTHDTGAYQTGSSTSSSTSSDSASATTYSYYASYDPIVIDLSNTGKIDTAYNIWKPHTDRMFDYVLVVFDIDGDGINEFMEWTGPQAGLLVMPTEAGKVECGFQLFGNTEGYANGYEKLSALFDKNQDGTVKGDELAGLKVWIDKNSNGQAEESELSALKALGITEVGCKHTEYSSICKMNGSNVRTWDYWPSGKKVNKEISEMLAPVTGNTK